MVKLSVVQTFVLGIDIDKMQAQVPETFDLRHFLAQPGTLWVSEVRATVVYLAMRGCFPDDDAFVDEALRRNHRVLEQSVFRAVRYVLTRGLVLRLGVQSFRLMHKGLDLVAPTSSDPKIDSGAAPEIDADADADTEPDATAPTTARHRNSTTTQIWELHGAPFLVPPIIGRCYATALQAAVELSGAIEARTFISVHSPTITRVSLAVTNPERSS